LRQRRRFYYLRALTKCSRGALKPHCHSVAHAHPSRHSTSGARADSPNVGWAIRLCRLLHLCDHQLRETPLFSHLVGGGGGSEQHALEAEQVRVVGGQALRHPPGVPPDRPESACRGWVVDSGLKCRRMDFLASNLPFSSFVVGLDDYRTGPTPSPQLFRFLLRTGLVFVPVCTTKTRYGLRIDSNTYKCYPK